MAVSRNPWAWGLGASLALGLLPALGAMHAARQFVSERAGRSEAEQLAMLRQPWTQPSFMRMVATLSEILPADAKLLCTPTAGDDDSGKSRWFLFLADALYPRQVYVRHPKPASGTLMDYPEWVAYHFEVLGTDGRRFDLGGVLRREDEQALIAKEVAARGIEWEFEYRADTLQPFTTAKLFHNGVPVPLKVESAPMEVEEE